ncbi:MAG: hypothetical protein R2716_02010 [Microthrixaceae bacterium]
MDLGHGIDLAYEDLDEFCTEHGVKRLALFGSVLGDRFTAEATWTSWSSSSRGGRRDC